MNGELWLKRANRALSSASLLFEHGDVDRACSTAYYAMFYAARAALIHVGQPERAMGKTHSGTVAGFHQFVVLPGLVDELHGQAFTVELNRRLLADYGPYGVDEAAATEAIAGAEAFVLVVADLIETREAGAGT